MKDELASMRGSNMFSSFYGTLKNINEYHHKYPNILNIDSESPTIPEFEVNFFLSLYHYPSSYPSSHRP